MKNIIKYPKDGDYGVEIKIFLPELLEDYEKFESLIKEAAGVDEKKELPILFAEGVESSLDGWEGSAPVIFRLKTSEKSQKNQTLEFRQWVDKILNAIKESSYLIEKPVKYELTSMVKIHHGIKLYRIRAVKDGVFYKKGDLGGWVQSLWNLSHRGESWIFDEAMAYENARVSSSARIYNSSEVFGNAKIRNSYIRGKAKIYGNAKVWSSRLHGNTEIYGNAEVGINCFIDGGNSGIKIYDQAKLSTKVYVSNSEGYEPIEICGDSSLKGGVKGITVKNGAKICGDAHFSGEAVIRGDQEEWEATKVLDIENFSGKWTQEKIDLIKSTDLKTLKAEGARHQFATREAELMEQYIDVKERMTLFGMSTLDQIEASLWFDSALKWVMHHSTKKERSNFKLPQQVKLKTAKEQKAYELFAEGVKSAEIDNSVTLYHNDGTGLLPDIASAMQECPDQSCYICSQL